MQPDEIKALARSVEPYVLEVRRYLHANPELSYHEEQTAACVADWLREMGYEPETRVGGQLGVRAVLHGGRPGPTIGLRAEMDALPVAEQCDLPYRSRQPGVMHACGHDAHTAMLLGVARALMQMREQLAGSVVFLFQPAEEVGPGGALAMVQAGALTGVDAVFALHVAPGLDTGKLAFLDGLSSANSDRLRISITGRAGHAAQPHSAVDAVVVAGHVIVALQQIVARQVAPTQGAVITIGKVNGGTKGNIIAERVELTGTVRTLDGTLRESMPGRIEALVNGICAAFGARGRVQYKMGYPACINDPAMVALARRAAALMVGPENLTTSDISLGGEDFAYMLQVTPGATGHLGVGNPATPPAERHPLHSPLVVVDEDAMVHGMAFYLALIDLATQEGSPLRR